MKPNTITQTIVLALAATLLGAAPSNAKEGTTVVVGDSIAAGYNVTQERTWPSRLGYSNLAAGGSCLITYDCGTPIPLLQSLDSVLAMKPDRILVHVGRNDLCHQTTADLIQGFKNYRNNAESAGVDIQFATITPAGAGWRWPCEEQRVEVNEWLRHQPGVLDFEAATINRRGLLRWIYDSGDGLHLNARGFRALAKVAREAT